TAKAHLEAVRARAPKDPTGMMGEVLAPLIEGLHAFAQGDYAITVAKIEPLRPRIVELGGSRAQRDVFHDTLFEACFRAGDVEHAGDMLSPSPMSTVLRGAQMIAVLNAVGLDGATFGNHEFDFGPRVLRERMSESRFTWLSANVLELGGVRPFGGAAREQMLE